MEFKEYKMEDISTFSQGKQVEIEKQYTKQFDNMKRFLRIIDFTNPNEPIRYVEDYGNRYYVTKEDLVMIRYGSQTCGKVVIGKEGIIANNMFKINLDNSIVLNRYAYYFLKQDLVYNYLRSSQNSSTMPSINFGILNKLEIEIPNLDNQRKIVKILCNIDQKIESNNNINNNLYKLIKNNYESLINGCNWEEVELGAISNITSGKRPVDKSETGEYPVIGANGIMAYTSDYNFNEDLIITGRVGTLGAVKRYLGEIWASDNTLVIQTKYLNYIENYLKTIDYYSLNRGSTQPLLTQGDLKKQIIYFNEKLVTKFEKDNQIFVDKIRNNEKENSKLIQLRDTLLPKLMNGEIDLDNIEI